MDSTPAPSPQRWWVLGCVGAGMFLLFLDSSVNVALPALAQGLNTTLPGVRWIIIVYLLLRAALLPGLGRAGDLFPLKPFLALGLGLYTLGVAGAGFSESVPHMAVMRAIQAVGTGMVWAAGPALVVHAFSSGERGRALGLMTAAGTAGMLSGPLLGGWVLGWWGWPGIFWFRVPLGVAATALALWRVTSPPPPSPRPRYDLFGALTLSAGLALVILALGLLGQGYPSPLAIFLGLVGLGLLAGFVLTQARSPAPLLPPSLLRQRLFLVALTRGYLGYGAWFVTMFLFPFFMEERLGFSPIIMGVMLTAVPATATLLSPFSGWASDRMGSRGLVSGGLVLLTAGLVLLSQFQGGDSTWALLGVLVLMGVGFGLFQAPNYNALIGWAPQERVSTAAAFLTLSTTLGSISTVSLVSAFFPTRQRAYGASYPEGAAFDLAYRDTVLLFAALGALGTLISYLWGREAQPPTSSISKKASTRVRN